MNNQDPRPGDDYRGHMDETTVNDSVETDTADELVEEELLVEEISIDGMCGVY